MVFTTQPDAADYLVNHGVPFRDAHGIIGQLVLLCIEKKIPLDDLPLEESIKDFSCFLKRISTKQFSMKTCVEKRNTIGAPGEEAMKKVIAANALLFAGKLIVNDSKIPVISGENLTRN